MVHHIKDDLIHVVERTGVHFVSNAVIELRRIEIVPCSFLFQKMYTIYERFALKNAIFVVFDEL